MTLEKPLTMFATLAAARKILRDATQSFLHTHRGWPGQCRGYMLKDATPHDIVQAIRDVYEEKTVLHPSVSYVLLQALQTSSRVFPKS